MQLEIEFWSRRSLRFWLTRYLATQCDHVADATRGDYEERQRWLLEVFGEDTPISSITFARMEDVARAYGPKGAGLMNVTVKRRLVYLRSVLKWAHARGEIQAVPALPANILRDDGRRRKNHHEVEHYEAMRPHVTSGPRRRFVDLAFWTGHHNLDLYSFTCDMLRPDEPFHLPDGSTRTGVYLRRNHKNKHSAPRWLPMEPELRLLALGWRAEMGDAWHEGAPLVGKIWSMTKSLAAACSRADVVRVSPIDLRRSFATMLAGRGYPNEYIRHALGHEGEDSRTQGGESRRPSMASRHYLQFTPGLALKSS